MQGKPIISFIIKQVIESTVYLLVMVNFSPLFCFLCFYYRFRKSNLYLYVAENGNKIIIRVADNWNNCLDCANIHV
jgi:hypothetical protein